MTKYFNIGIDVGSTTVKTVVLTPEGVLQQEYYRHDGQPLTTLIRLLRELSLRLPEKGQALCRIAFTGSQSSGYATHLHAAHVQEVIAGSIAISKLYPQTQTAVELGGQDAKMLFFGPNREGTRKNVRDMRMNGVCAGGTGAFIDQIASLLNIPVEDFNTWAAAGTQEYEISGRCGVFAKTDIQPLLNQGIPREDIAWSCLHALAKQTIGGLAQGMEIRSPVLLAGGPIFFNPTLQNVFRTRLHLTEDQIIVPAHAQTLIARGAALALDSALNRREDLRPLSEIITSLETLSNNLRDRPLSTGTPFFTSSAERTAFVRSYSMDDSLPSISDLPAKLTVSIGIDAGSTTTKFVCISPQGEILYTFYRSNRGEPMETARRGLLEFLDSMEQAGKEVTVHAVGTTGYGEDLFAQAFGADYHTVETIAHKEAACFYEPETDFILDLGGQDMKAIFLQQGVITDIILNEACSAGCGSFIESYSRSIGVAPQDIAGLAFTAHNPPDLGSRCTVFMNSSIITEQKQGRSREDILAGLCRSVIENLFTKVVRVSNFAALGKKIVVQGGTFKNDAVLKAMIDYTGREVLRPPHPGEMGALGIALLAQKHQSGPSDFIGRQGLEKLSYTVENIEPCRLCSNLCSRTVTRFSTGRRFVKGNRCPRGEYVTPQIKPSQTHRDVPDCMKYREQYLLKTAAEAKAPHFTGETVGIPLVLDFYHTLPFWTALFNSFGCRVVTSGRSTYPLFEEGLKQVPSDTVCFPAKLVHGHMRELLRRGADTLFFPYMLKSLPEHAANINSWNCAVLQGYPEIIRTSDFTDPRFADVRKLTPSFKWSNDSLQRDQVVHFLREEFNLSKKAARTALAAGREAQEKYVRSLRREGRRALEWAQRDEAPFAAVLAARPYHGDMLVNHRISTLFTAYSIPVLINEALPRREINQKDLRIDLTNNYHTQLINAAYFSITTPAAELVQLVSFGCGHDAVYSDEISRIMRESSNKVPLILKIDESDNPGPLKIRITSFVETVRTRRKISSYTATKVPEAPYSRQFTPQDRQKKILIPHLSKSFTTLLGEALKDQGYHAIALKKGGQGAVSLGKQFVHNDICFPAQLNVGEHIEWLRRHREEADNCAVLFAKNCHDCRAGHYTALGRKALDEAGFPQVPIVTTDFKDPTDVHPGFSMNELRFNLFTLRGLALIDALDDMLYKCRPYETVAGSTDELHETHLKRVLSTLRRKGFSRALKELSQAVTAFNALQTDRTERRPRVGIIGEILVNYHPTANYEIFRYLEESGMEIVLPAMIEFWRQDAVNWQVMAERGHSRAGIFKKYQGRIYGGIFSAVINAVERPMKNFKYYEAHSDIHTIAQNAQRVMDISYRTGEGWLIPGEILTWQQKGIASFLIIQPFGCLPNHITGKGLIKSIKQEHPESTVISLDFDPDTSTANIHNRLQMLVLNSRKEEVRP
ncbi:MAG: acyl-CoA dehydratase activase [Fibrobacterota bacterium]